MTAPTPAMRERAERVANRSRFHNTSDEWFVVYAEAMAALLEQHEESSRGVAESAQNERAGR